MKRPLPAHHPHHPFQLRTTLKISSRLVCQLSLLRQRLEAHYRIAIDEERLLEYLVETALERVKKAGDQ